MVTSSDDRGKVIKVSPLGTNPLTSLLKQYEILVPTNHVVGHPFLNDRKVQRVLDTLIPSNYEVCEDAGYHSILDPEIQGQKLVDYTLLICNAGPRAWYGDTYNKLYELSKRIKFVPTTPEGAVWRANFILPTPVPIDQPIVDEVTLKDLEKQHVSMCCYDESLHTLQFYRLKETQGLIDFLNCVCYRKGNNYAYVSDLHCSNRLKTLKELNWLWEEFLKLLLVDIFEKHNPGKMKLTGDIRSRWNRDLETCVHILSELKDDIIFPELVDILKRDWELDNTLLLFVYQHLCQLHPKWNTPTIQSYFQ